MEYDYTGVTEVRYDRATKRLEVYAGRRKHVVEGVESLYVKSAPFIDADGTIHFNRARVSIDRGEAMVGD